MEIQFNCPKCGLTMQAAIDGTGGAVQCPDCGQEFVVNANPPPAPVVQAHVVPAPQPSPQPHLPAPNVHHAPHAPHAPHAHHPTPHAHPPHRPGQVHPHHPAPPVDSGDRSKLIALCAAVVVLLIGAGLLMSRASKANKEATKAPVATPVDSIAKIETDLKQAELDRKLKAIEDEQAKAKKIADEKAEAAKREESEAHDRMVARDKAEYEQKVKAYAETYFNGDLQVAEAFVKALQNTIFEVRDLANDGDPSNDPKNEEEATGILTKRLVRHLERDAVASKWLKENNQDPEKFVTGLVDGGKRGGKYEGPANQFDFSKYASMGSGFWISSDGWILSNEHVVGDAKVVDLRLADGKMLQAKVIKVDEEKDLALLKAELAPVGWLAVSAGGKDLSLGRTVFTVGYPDPVVQGVEPKFTDGRVSAASGIGDRKDSYQTTVPVQHGNSGGALVDFDTGWVVGVVNARLESRSGVGADNVSYAIKGNVVRGFLESEPDAKAAVLKKAPTALPKGDQNAIIGRATQSAVLILKLRKEP